jgi:acetylornithine/N-succinyldiaminopimelate aminotransferase
VNRSGSPNSIRHAAGIEITDAEGTTRLDLLAAMASSLGHRHDGLLLALNQVADAYLGPGAILSAWVEPTGENRPVPTPRWDAPFSEFAAVRLLPSVAEANDLAIQLARQIGLSGEAARLGGRGTAARDAYRVITLLGSELGDTLACRSASGTFERQASLGPLVPGFRHVAPGDLRAIERSVDSQTAAILLAPVDWSRGGLAWDADFLPKVRELCDAKNLLLMLDETRLPAAIGGRWFYHQTADIRPDIVIASAGWTGGLPGGLVMVTRQDHAAIAFGQDRSNRGDSDYPLLLEIVRATAAGIESLGGPERAIALGEAWQAGLQELVEGFEFLADIEIQGLWAVLRSDIDAHGIAAACGRAGVRLAVTNDTTLLACPPLSVTANNLIDIFARLRSGLEMVERETIES